MSDVDERFAFKLDIGSTGGWKGGFSPLDALLE